MWEPRLCLVADVFFYCGFMLRIQRIAVRFSSDWLFNCAPVPVCTTVHWYSLGSPLSEIWLEWVESFQLQMGFSFPFLRANDLRLSLLIIRARNFYSIVRRGYIHKVSVQLVPKYFSRDCSTDSIPCSERRKKRMKTILKQDSKSRKEDQNVVVVTNPSGSSSNTCHCCRSAVAPLSLHCRSVVSPLSYRYLSAVAPLLLLCRTAIAPLLHLYHTSIAPLLLRCLSAAVDTQSHRYRSAAVTPAVDTQSLLLLPPLLIRCHSAVAPQSLLSLCFRCCRSCCSNAVTDAIAPAVTHGCRLKRQNQGNGFHRWLSGARVLLLRGVFKFAENSQGGSLLT